MVDTPTTTEARALYERFRAAGGRWSLWLVRGEYQAEDSTGRVLARGRKYLDVLRRGCAKLGIS